MTAREEYAALVAKMNAAPAAPLLALSPAERVRYGQLRDRFGSAEPASRRLAGSFR